MLQIDVRGERWGVELDSIKKPTFEGGFFVRRLKRLLLGGKQIVFSNNLTC